MTDTAKPMGLLFFRDGGKDPDGRPVRMVVGVLYAPDEEIQNECQYVVTDFNIHKSTKVDREMLARGMGIGSLLLEPIWRTVRWERER